MAPANQMLPVSLLTDDDDDDQFTDDEDANQNGFTVVTKLIFYFLFLFEIINISSFIRVIEIIRNEEIKPWDPFREIPIEDTSGALAQKKMVDAFSTIAKVLAYILTFTILLAAAVCSKGTLLFMTSQLRTLNGNPDVTTEYCSTRNELKPFSFQ